MEVRIAARILALALCSLPLCAESDADRDQYPVGWDKPPAECASGLYRFNGERFLCQGFDRVDGLIAQRNHYYQANAACIEREKANTTAREMDRLQTAARAECRKDGRKFDANTFTCSTEPLEKQ